MDIRSLLHHHCCWGLAFVGMDLGQSLSGHSCRVGWAEQNPRTVATKCLAPHPLFLQRDALEQRNHPESLCGLHPEAAEGAATLKRDGNEAAQAGAGQSQPAAASAGG